MKSMMGVILPLKTLLPPIKTINAKMARFPFSQRKISGIPNGFWKKIKNWLGGKNVMPLFLILVFGLCRTKKWPDPKKNGWQNFSTIIVLVWGQSWKKVVYITMPKYLIFHFLSKTPILTKNGSPAPQGGQRKKSLACIKKLSNNNSY